MLIENHHILDKRGVNYLQEILAKKQTVNETFRNLVVSEESEKLTALFSSLSSRPFVISLIYDIAGQILATFNRKE